jgi:hypothetical protein
MIILIYLTLVQMNPGKSRFAFPYDTASRSTKGFLQLQRLGHIDHRHRSGKSFLDKEWRGRFVEIAGKKKKRNI